MSATGLHINSRELNISIIENGVIHKVSWVYFRQHVLNYAAAIANVIPLRNVFLVFGILILAVIWVWGWVCLVALLFCFFCVLFWWG
jgi:hypothetical protein